MKSIFAAALTLAVALPGAALAHVGHVAPQAGHAHGEIAVLIGAVAALGALALALRARQ